MESNLFKNISDFFQENIMGYITNLYQHPLNLIVLIVDLAIVIFLAYKLVRIAQNSRAWQLVKGIVFLVLATWISSLLGLRILHFILDAIMNWGVLALIVIFQPEIRRALEQLGTNKFTKFLGMEQDIATKTKEDIYKIVIAAEELSKRKIGALIVIERDIEIKDIINTGILMDADVSPQLLTNIFIPKTPLHDGAVVISNNKIAAAACMLPLAGDNDIARELGTRHRAGIGISKESDSIAVIVSEETGKISVAKDGTLIADVREDVLKKILISNIVTKRFVEKKKKSNENFILKLRKKMHKTEVITKTEEKK